MRTGLKNTVRLAACSTVLAGVLLLATAQAFAQEPYGTVGTTPSNGDSATQVLAETVVRPAAAANPAAANPAAANAAAANAAAAGRLALTGADIAQLSVVAIMCIAFGAVLVLRARRPLLS